MTDQPHEHESGTDPIDALENEQQSQDTGQRVDPAATEGALVNLPQLIANEFGSSASEIRMAMALGSTTIDGKPFTGFDIAREDLQGKRIEVKSESRHFSMTYHGEAGDRFFR